MQAAELLAMVSAAGGQFWLEEGRVRARLPESLRPMVDVLREHRDEIIELLSSRPDMPAGVRLIHWDLKNAPVQLSRCETATDVDQFVRSTLRQVEARLRGKNWLAGNGTPTTLIDRLAACGCIVALDDRKAMLQ
jgi:hypothetical protein